MSDRALGATVAAVVAGALLAWPFPTVLLAGALALAVALRHPVVMAVAALVLASVLAARAWSGLAPPEAPRLEGRATLVGDPEPFGPGVRALVRLQGARLDARFHGSAAGAVRPLLAGDRVVVAGAVSPLDRDDRWLAVRHVRGRLAVSRVGTVERAGGVGAVANRVRRLLDTGASVLDDDRRSLVLGVTVGDDRDQSPLVRDRFRAVGLSHLLAVSGQNVAFVLAAAEPALRRLGLGARWAATVGLLGAFGLVTRFEPSVLRATAMAAVAATGTAVGRPALALRSLGLAVGGLVLVDPLLVHSTGFRLSVAASAAIVLAATRIAAALPGPRWLAEPLGLTLAAQAGVLPILLAIDGAVPVAAVPANLLAGPVVGPLTVWGMTAGLVAGAVPPRAAALLHAPTHLLAGWLLAVVHRVDSLGLGGLDGRHAVVLAIAGAALAAARRCGRCTLGRWGRAAALALLVTAVVAAGLTGPGAERPGRHRPPVGAPGVERPVRGGG